MTPEEALAAAEAAYLAAREARDHLDVARAIGSPSDAAAIAGLESAAAATSAEVHARLDAISDTDATRLDADDRRALETMRAGIATADDYELPVGADIGPDACADAAMRQAAIQAGGGRLQQRMEACYAAAAASIQVDGEPLTRLQVLERLGAEPDAGARRGLFVALEPLWVAVNGDDAGASPYRAWIAEQAGAWRAEHDSDPALTPLGVGREGIEQWAIAVLAAWRSAVVEPARAAGEPDVEPWDWWWRAGAAQRAIGDVPLDEALAINRELYASLGADVDELRIRYDVQAHAGRPPVPVAFTTFGGRPHLTADGWSPGAPVVISTMTGGGIGELAELLHETGHAIHIAGIRTRPAYADWPDSDALTEAIADIVAFDVAEPAWQRRWLPGRAEVPEAQSLHCWHAGVVLDTAWALFEIRMLTDPSCSPNEVWTELTSTWLGIAPHPEWSWWAIRGQLVQEAGYMANYSVGAVLATALRAAIREARGDWLAGDPGWYAWVRDELFRFGLERPSRDVLRDILGGPPTPDALLAEIDRAARPH